jgi:RNA polymerase sigma-70 factor (ECF subfamily)
MTFEERLAAALDRRDQDAAATLVIEELGPQVLGYLRALLRDPEEAEDVFSAFAENVWKGLGTWRRDGSLRSWAYRVAWNAASRVHRDPYRRRKERLATTMASRLAMSMAAASRHSMERKATELDALRATLTQEEQSLLTLRLDRDLSWREVAEIMAEDGRPADEAALRQRFARLKEKLAKAVKARGLVRRG